MFLGKMILVILNIFRLRKTVFLYSKNTCLSWFFVFVKKSICVNRKVNRLRRNNIILPPAIQELCAVPLRLFFIKRETINITTIILVIISTFILKSKMYDILWKIPFIACLEDGEILPYGKFLIKKLKYDRVSYILEMLRRFLLKHEHLSIFSK